MEESAFPIGETSSIASSASDEFQKNNIVVASNGETFGVGKSALPGNYFMSIASNHGVADHGPSPMVKLRRANSGGQILLHSLSTNDASLGEYKYTVNVGNHSIKITGDSLDLVRVRK